MFATCKMNRRIGKFELVTELGAGGMAIVFMARDTMLGRTVALKVIKEKIEERKSIRRRFVREAQLAAGLSHPNIVTIFEFGMEDDRLFIAMEYLKGCDLRQLMDRQEKMGLQEQIDLALQVAKALRHAHAHGVVHRDIKPTNIRILDSGLVKLVDFGIAKLASKKQLELTRAGSLIGSVSYMSPEQARSRPITKASDIFSFGSLLYEILTRRAPFDGEDIPSTLYNIVHEEPLPIESPEIPELFSELIWHCLRKDPEERIDSFDTLFEELRIIRATVTSVGGAWITPDPDETLRPLVQDARAKPRREPGAASTPTPGDPKATRLMEGKDRPPRSTGGKKPGENRLLGPGPPGDELEKRRATRLMDQAPPLAKNAETSLYLYGKRHDESHAITAPKSMAKVETAPARLLTEGTPLLGPLETKDLHDDEKTEPYAPQHREVLARMEASFRDADTAFDVDPESPPRPADAALGKTSFRDADTAFGVDPELLLQPVATAPRDEPGLSDRASGGDDERIEEFWRTPSKRGSEGDLQATLYDRRTTTPKWVWAAILFLVLVTCAGGTFLGLRAGLLRDAQIWVLKTLRPSSRERPSKVEKPLPPEDWAAPSVVDDAPLKGSGDTPAPETTTSYEE